jgi:hypothetical protein
MGIIMRFRATLLSALFAFISLGGCKGQAQDTENLLVPTATGKNLAGVEATTGQPAALKPVAVVLPDILFQDVEELTAEDDYLRRWGVIPQAIRLTSAGHMLDFRYRIKDPEKALPLVDRTNRPYLLHEKSGNKLPVPVPGKVGPLRQTEKYGKPKVDRNYFVMFSNPGRVVQAGDSVTVVIGDFEARNLIVE